MALSLRHLSILIVEDDRFSRRLLEGILVDMGFGKVFVVGNGKEAIDRLRDAAGSRTNRALIDIDIILSDMFMSPVDGLLLLRWVRSDGDSPNRFMPFAMVSGAADVMFVRAARDQGVTQFLAKPFSVQSVARHLKALIDEPRQFVMTRDFFGPDRRRHSKGIRINGTDRRRTGEDHCIVVTSAAPPGAETMGAGDTWLFKLPNLLKARMGGGVRDGGFSIPPELLQKAEATLQRQALEFDKWASAYLDSLARMLVEANKQEPGSRQEQLARINRVAHELRGQGGTFGYPLITTFAKSLYEATLPGMDTSEKALKIVRIHLEAMRAVLRDKVKGSGGHIGTEIVGAFEASLEKVRGGMIGGSAPEVSTPAAD